jgi:transcriptional regulator of acetoin/glycerol metabolism
VWKKVFGDGTPRFSPQAIECLCNYPWPGNIREMINVFELCHALSDSGVIGLEDLPDSVTSSH